MLDEQTRQLIRLLDAAMTSDNAGIKAQLQSLLVTASLVHGGDENAPGGPLAALFASMREMEADISRLRQRITDLEHYQKKDSMRTTSSSTRWSNVYLDDGWEDKIKYYKKLTEARKGMNET